MHGAISLIDGGIGVGGESGIRVGNGNLAESFAAKYPRLLAFGPLGIE